MFSSTGSIGQHTKQRSAPPSRKYSPPRDRKQPPPHSSQRRAGARPRAATCRLQHDPGAATRVGQARGGGPSATGARSGDAHGLRPPLHDPRLPSAPQPLPLPNGSARVHPSRPADTAASVAPRGAAREVGLTGGVGPAGGPRGDEEQDGAGDGLGPLPLPSPWRQQRAQILGASFTDCSGVAVAVDRFDTAKAATVTDCAEQRDNPPTGSPARTPSGNVTLAPARWGDQMRHADRWASDPGRTHSERGGASPIQV